MMSREDEAAADFFNPPPIREKEMEPNWFIKRGSSWFLKMGILITIIGAMFFAIFFIILMFVAIETWPSWANWTFTGIMFGGAAAGFLVGGLFMRMGNFTWFLEVAQIHKYKPVSFGQLIRYRIFGIDRSDVPKDTVRYYDTAPPTAHKMPRKVNEDYKCARCGAENMPGDELCTSCGEPLK